MSTKAQAGVTTQVFEPRKTGVCLEGAPQMAAAVSSKFSTHGGGGWNWILSDLKSLLETGKNLGA